MLFGEDMIKIIDPTYIKKEEKGDK